MDIAKRLRELREARYLTQQDVEARSGLRQSYISAVESGRTVPTLKTLERWANALGVETYQCLQTDGGAMDAERDPEIKASGHQERKLFELFGRMREKDRRLLLSVASDLAKRRD